MTKTKQQLINSGIIDAKAAEKLERYVQLFEMYNSHTNLSSIRQTDGIWLKHIADSLILLQFEKPEGKLLDIGTGGGLPGIPLAIASSKLKVTLLDSIGKKIKACDHFIERLNLKNVTTLHARAERIGQELKYVDRYDWVVSRATAYLPTILAWSEQFIKPGGKIALYKTPSTGELGDGNAAAKFLGLKLIKSHLYAIDNQERQLLIYTTMERKKPTQARKMP